MQFAVQGAIVLDGDSARSTTLCHEAARGPGDQFYRNHCLAVDEMVRTPEGWRFASRWFHYLWLDTSPFAGDAVPLP